MSRNSRNGLYRRMEYQELSLMANSMKTSVRPPVAERSSIVDRRERKPIREEWELKNSFRL